MNKKTVFVDLDGVLVDLIDRANFELSDSEHYKTLEDVIDFSETVFLESKPMKDALESFAWLEEHFDVYILSTAPWLNVNAWFQKRIWVENYLPTMRKKLILTHHKHLLKDDFLIDDRTKNGAAEFEGEHIHIFAEKFPNWKSVTEYLKMRV